jgi:hypothetical protein
MAHGAVKSSFDGVASCDRTQDEFRFQEKSLEMRRIFSGIFDA